MLNSLDSGKPVFPPEYIDTDPAATVCITGHREKNIIPYQKNPVYMNMTVSAVKLMLQRYIDIAAEQGYTDFISGLAIGCDLWAAEHILRKKAAGWNIRLIGAMPYLRHSERFPAEYKRLLRQVEEGADYLISVNTEPSAVYCKKGGWSSLYRDRNYFMVDNSSAVIAFLNSDTIASGTAQTVNYAYRTSRRIYRFGLEDVFSIMDSAGPDLRNISREIALSDFFSGLPF